MKSITITAKDIVARCADTFLIPIVEGDADCDVFDPKIHRLCLGAPQQFGRLANRYENEKEWAMGPRKKGVGWKRPSALRWTPASMAYVVEARLDLDYATDEQLELALELSRHCPPTVALRLVRVIEVADRMRQLEFDLEGEGFDEVNDADLEHLSRQAPGVAGAPQFRSPYSKTKLMVGAESRAESLSGSMAHPWSWWVGR